MVCFTWFSSTQRSSIPRMIRKTSSMQRLSSKTKPINRSSSNVSRAMYARFASSRSFTVSAETASSILAPNPQLHTNP